MVPLHNIDDQSVDELLDVIGALVVFLDPDGRIVRFNKTCETVTGYREDEAVGRLLWELLITDDEVGQVRQVFGELRAGHHPSRYENDWKTRDGGRRRISWTNTVSLAADGSVQYVIGTGVDMTATVEAERALRENRAILQSTIDSCIDGIVTIDADGKIQSLNPAAERIFGYGAGEVIGRNVSMLMPSPDREAHKTYIRRYLDTGERKIIGIGREVKGQRKDGSTFPMELGVGEARMGDNHIFTGFIRDVSKHQAALRERDERLRELQMEFTHVSRLSAMGEMAATLAHELNQPLTAVMNYVQAGRRMLDAPEIDMARTTELMSKAADQAQRAGDIIRRLRSFVARGESERLPEDMNEVVREACALALVGARSDGIDVDMDMDESLPPVLIDRVQIQQVLVNLVRNSVDAMMNQDERAISVRTMRNGEDAVEVVIADNGPGLAPEIAEHLFEPFNTSKPDGMGIGLTVCRSIIEDHGGRIWSAPVDGSGTDFRFTVPLRQDMGDEHDG